MITASDAGTGHLHGTWTADSSISTSDRRLKKDIEPLERTIEHSAVLRELRPVSFVMKDDGGIHTNKRRYGFIAQELERVLPDIVFALDNDTKAVAYQDLIAVLTLAIQEQDARLGTLESRIGDLSAKIDRILEAFDRKSLLDETRSQTIVIN
jgi:hypothetical protein